MGSVYSAFFIGVFDLHDSRRVLIRSRRAAAGFDVVGFSSAALGALTGVTGWFCRQRSSFGSRAVDGARGHGRVERAVASSGRAGDRKLVSISRAKFCERCRDSGRDLGVALAYPGFGALIKRSDGRAPLWSVVS